MINPTIILNREDETLPFNFLFAQNKATDVPKKMINIALIDWNHEAGTCRRSVGGRRKTESISLH
jgi:hypothetical protein